MVVNLCPRKYAVVNTKLVITTRELVVRSAYLSHMIDDKWFKQQQRRVGVTAEHIALRLGKDRSLVSRIYVGRQQMKIGEARVFAEILQQPIDEVLRRAGVANGSTAQQLAPGFAESDVATWQPDSADAHRVKTIAEAMGARPGVDIWQVKSAELLLEGVLPGDYILVDSHAAESVRVGDLVIAQVYDNAKGGASTILRRFEPPVLVAASTALEDRRVHIVDGTNVVIRGKIIASWRKN